MMPSSKYSFLSVNILLSLTLYFKIPHHYSYPSFVYSGPIEDPELNISF